MPGWWFGTFFIFPYVGNVIIPFDFHIFFKMVGQPPTRCSCSPINFPFGDDTTHIIWCSLGDAWPAFDHTSSVFFAQQWKPNRSRPAHKATTCRKSNAFCCRKRRWQPLISSIQMDPNGRFTIYTCIYIIIYIYTCIERVPHIHIVKNNNNT